MCAQHQYQKHFGLCLFRYLALLFSVFRRQFHAIFSSSFLSGSDVHFYKWIYCHMDSMKLACVRLWILLYNYMCMCRPYEWMLDHRAPYWTQSRLCLCIRLYRNQLKQRMLIDSKRLKIGVSDHAHTRRCEAESTLCSNVCNPIITIKVLRGQMC